MDRLTVNRRYGRLLLMSTVLLPTLSVVRSQLCGIDEFFDGVVRGCVLCSAVCSPPTQAHSYCQKNCGDYYDRVMAQLARNPVTSSALLTVQQTQPSTVQSPHWAFSPFVWTLVGCLMVMATVIITTMLVLCVVRRHTAIRYDSVVDSEVGSGRKSTSCKCESTSTAWTKTSDKSIYTGSVN
jgi:hypothetical protein